MTALYAVALVAGCLAVTFVICSAQYFLLTLVYRDSHKRAEAALRRERQEFVAHLNTSRPSRKAW